MAPDPCRAGNNITKIVRIENTGGEGAFRLIVNEDEPPEDYYYESLGPFSSQRLARNDDLT